jgi:hypothetical protein
LLADFPLPTGFISSELRLTVNDAFLKAFGLPKSIMAERSLAALPGSIPQFVKPAMRPFEQGPAGSGREMYEFTDQGRCLRAHFSRHVEWQDGRAEVLVVIEAVPPPLVIVVTSSLERMGFFAFLISTVGYCELSPVPSIREMKRRLKFPSAARLVVIDGELPLEKHDIETLEVIDGEHLSVIVVNDESYSEKLTHVSQDALAAELRVRFGGWSINSLTKVV